jgi:hypothetical protein
MVEHFPRYRLTGGSTTQSQRPHQHERAVILGGIGAVMLVLSPYLSWVTATLDLSDLFGSFGLPSGTSIPGVQNPVDVSGNGFDDQIYGWISLVAGLLVAVAIVVLLARAISARGAGYLVLAGGLVGGVWALYDGLVRFDNLPEDAFARATPYLGAFPGGGSLDQVNSATSVSPQIGVWVAALGGLLSLIAGIMFLTAKDDAAADAAGTSPAFAGAPAAPPESSTTQGGGVTPPT